MTTAITHLNVGVVLSPLLHPFLQEHGVCHQQPIAFSGQEEVAHVLHRPGHPINDSIISLMQLLTSPFGTEHNSSTTARADSYARGGSGPGELCAVRHTNAHPSMCSWVHRVAYQCTSQHVLLRPLEEFSLLLVALLVHAVLGPQVQAQPVRRRARELGHQRGRKLHHRLLGSAPHNHGHNSGAP